MQHLEGTWLGRSLDDITLSWPAVPNRLATLSTQAAG